MRLVLSFYTENNGKRYNKTRKKIRITSSNKSKKKTNKKLIKMQHNNDIISGKISSDIENMEWSMGTTTAQLPNVR